MFRHLMRLVFTWAVLLTIGLGVYTWFHGETVAHNAMDIAGLFVILCLIAPAGMVIFVVCVIAGFVSAARRAAIRDQARWIERREAQKAQDLHNIAKFYGAIQD